MKILCMIHSNNLGFLQSVDRLCFLLKLNQVEQCNGVYFSSICLLGYNKNRVWIKTSTQAKFDFEHEMLSDKYQYQNLKFKQSENMALIYI